MSIQVKVVLDQPNGSLKYTNLDAISGRVILRLFQPCKVSYIVAKLEGESRTRLEGFDPVRNRNEQFLEIHKLLYKTQRVFPANDVPMDPRGKQVFMLNPGSYEYPFLFKLPFNNACLANIEAHGPSTPFNMAGFNLEVSKAATSHVRTTLPPTMHQSLEAGIRYYVKATVNVPSMFKENPRSTQYFSFDPIEPPRANGDGEAYARRQHQFNDNPFAGPKRRISLFRSNTATAPDTPAPGAQLARFTIDMRLPNPSVLTCGADIPMRILIKSVGERSQPLFLKTFQIELVGHTKIRAQRTERIMGTSWVLVSLSNLHYPIGDHTVPDSEAELSKELYAGHNLPDAVCPSFITCNIERFYEIVVTVGLAYGSTKPGEDQFVAIPLRHRVEIYSGIKPPDELLRRVAEQGGPLASRPSASLQSPSAATGTSSQLHPAYPARPTQHQQHLAPQPQRPTGSGQHPEDPWLDPPPSYEDALGDDIIPTPGPQRPTGYNPGPMRPGNQGGLFNDEKS